MATSITGQGIAAYKAPDDALSSESKNAVQNKVIDGELSDVKNAISELNADILGQKLSPTTTKTNVYFSGDVGATITENSNSNSIGYIYDCSALVGQSVTVKFETAATSSSRVTALCSSAGLISEKYAEKDITASGFTFNITSTYCYIYASFVKATAETLEVNVNNGLVTILQDEINQIERISTQTIKKYGGLVGAGRVTSLSTYSDANSVTANSMLFILVDGFANLPTTLYNRGVLITLCPDNFTSTANGTYQIYIDGLNNRTAKRIRYNNAWSSWTVEYDPELDSFCCFALFTQIGVVGDSYASGAYGENASATSAVDHIAVSWPQILKRRSGSDVTNYTKGGRSTRTFISDTDSASLTGLLNDAAKELYILALIRNDYNIEVNGESGYLGSLADITDHSLGNYPDTFYGNYATIIERIKTHAPNAKIVLMTGDYLPSNTLGTQYNSAVSNIANHYELPCMVQLDDKFFQGEHTYYREYWPSGGHPGAIQYAGMEMAIERLFNRCIYNNRSYFRYYLPIT